MDNGLKYSDNNTIEVSILEKESELLINFENTGTSIIHSDMETIFEPFKRGSNSFKVKGHGIGLSLTKKIIELHDGKIEVKSIPGELTSFLITIPKNI
jgi:signal transduction histidine kinase